ncbi:MAG: translation elongation factor Ts [Chloroflexi bacterium]|nr:translation elongation factor Ts [Chloroflexota bacterium]
MAVTAEQVKELRERTHAGVMECKNALEEAGGDIAKAAEILKERGLALAEKRSDRETSQGLVECYVHAGGRIGSMVEVNCETDFVALTDEFKMLAHDLAMQVAATGPIAITAEELPDDTEEAPEEAVLLLQPFIKDASRTVDEVVKEVIAKTGENIRVTRISRFELGQ